MKTPFSEDDVRRNGLPDEVFGLLHDLCYDHQGRDRRMYMHRARKILTSDLAYPSVVPMLEQEIKWCKANMGESTGYKSGFIAGLEQAIKLATHEAKVTEIEEK